MTSKLLKSELEAEKKKNERALRAAAEASERALQAERQRAEETKEALKAALIQKERERATQASGNAVVYEMASARSANSESSFRQSAIQPTPFEAEELPPLDPWWTEGDQDHVAYELPVPTARAAGSSLQPRQSAGGGGGITRGEDQVV